MLDVQKRQPDHDSLDSKKLPALLNRTPFFELIACTSIPSRRQTLRLSSPGPHSESLVASEDNGRRLKPLNSIDYITMSDTAAFFANKKKKKKAFKFNANLVDATTVTPTVHV